MTDPCGISLRSADRGVRSAPPPPPPSSPCENSGSALDLAETTRTVVPREPSSPGGEMDMGRGGGGGYQDVHVWSTLLTCMRLPRLDPPAHTARVGVRN